MLYIFSPPFCTVGTTLLADWGVIDGTTSVKNEFAEVLSVVLRLSDPKPVVLVVHVFSYRASSTVCLVAKIFEWRVF